MITEKTIIANSKKDIQKLLIHFLNECDQKKLYEISQSNIKPSEKNYFIKKKSFHYLKKMMTHFSKSKNEKMLNDILRKFSCFKNFTDIQFTSSKNSTINILKDPNTIVIFVAPHFSNLDSLILNLFSYKYSFPNFIFDMGDNLLFKNGKFNKTTHKILSAGNAITIDRLLLKKSRIYSFVHNIYLKQKLLHGGNYILNFDPGRTYNGKINIKLRYPGMWKNISKISDEILQNDPQKNIFFLPASLQYRMIPDINDFLSLSIKDIENGKSLPPTDLILEWKKSIKILSVFIDNFNKITNMSFLSPILLKIGNPISYKLIKENFSLDEKRNYNSLIQNLRSIIFKDIFKQSIIYPETIFAKMLSEKFNLNINILNKDIEFDIKDLKLLDFNNVLTKYKNLSHLFNEDLIKRPNDSFFMAKTFFNLNNAIKENIIIKPRYIYYYVNLFDNILSTI